MTPQKRLELFHVYLRLPFSYSLLSYINLRMFFLLKMIRILII